MAQIQWSIASREGNFESTGLLCHSINQKQYHFQVCFTHLTNWTLIEFGAFAVGECVSFFAQSLQP